MTMTSVYAPIFKSTEQDDGSLMIYGKATGSDLDLDQQRCDPEWLKRAMPEWFKIGNIREQHDSKRAVGKATEHEVKDDGHYIKAHIVDPLAIAKTKAGVFTGLSIGIAKPRIEKTSTEEWVRDGMITEVSLCDRPCLPTATFTMCKAAKPGMQLKASDFDSTRMLVRCEEYLEKTPEPDLEKTKTDSSPSVTFSDMSLTLADRLPPEQAAKLASIAEAAAEKAAPTDVKTTDVNRTDAPNHSQTCVRCAEPGHLWCAPEGFDKDFAVGVVNETLEKAAGKGDGLGQDEGSDISGAEQAIAAIAALIISEAQDLANMPSQDCDIHLLMRAVDALRIFSYREKLEQDAVDPNSVICLTAASDVEKASDPQKPYGDVTYADPGYQSDKKKRYPLDTKAHAKAAWSYINQADNAKAYSSDDLSKIKSRIMTACKKFGVEVDSDSSKTVEPEKEATVSVDTAEKMYTLDEARAELGLPLAKSEGADEVTDPEPDLDEAAKAVDSEDTTKTTEPEVEKAAAVEEADPDALVKALTAALEKADNPLRKSFEAIVEAGQESTAKSVSDLSERLEKVEQMATPGGPALRRTETERVQSRKLDLEREVRRYKALASNNEDHTLRDGFRAKAAMLEAEIKAL